jgi:hypothetical protein
LKQIWTYEASNFWNNRVAMVMRCKRQTGVFLTISEVCLDAASLVHVLITWLRTVSHNMTMMGPENIEHLAVGSFHLLGVSKQAEGIYVA